MSLIGIGFGRRADFSSIPHLVPMSSLMMTSGTVVILALPSFHAGGASPLGVLAIVIASAGSIALLVLWAELLSRFDTSHIEVVVPVAFIATIFRAFVLPQANLGVLNAVVAALPLLSGLFLKISIVVADRDAKVKSCKAKLKLLAPRSLSLRQLLLSGMACLVFYALCCAAPYISGMRMVGESDGWLIMAASLVAVALAYGITLFSRRVDILAAYGWIGPVLLVGIGCAAYSDPLPLKASGLLVSAAFSCAEIVFLLYFIQLGKTTDCRMTLAVCFAEAMMYGGSLLGNAFGALAQEVLDLGWCILTSCVSPFSSLSGSSPSLYRRLLVFLIGAAGSKTCRWTRMPSSEIPVLTIGRFQSLRNPPMRAIFLARWLPIATVLLRANGKSSFCSCAVAIVPSFAMPCTSPKTP